MKIEKLFNTDIVTQKGNKIMKGIVAGKPATIIVQQGLDMAQDKYSLDLISPEANLLYASKLGEEITGFAQPAL